MGGASVSESKLGKLWVNYDIAANDGINAIKDDVANFSKHFADNNVLVDEIVVANPQAQFLEQIESSMKQGSSVTIIGTFNNKYFHKIWKQIENGETELDVFNVNIQNTYQGIPKQFEDISFTHSDGVTLIPTEKLKTITLTKQ